MTESKEKTAAVLTIFRASEMSARVRRDIARWLVKQAYLVERDIDSLSKTRYTARYLQRVKTEENEST